MVFDLYLGEWKEDHEVGRYIALATRVMRLRYMAETTESISTFFSSFHLPILY